MPMRTSCGVWKDATSSVQPSDATLPAPQRLPGPVVPLEGILLRRLNLHHRHRLLDLLPHLQDRLRLPSLRQYSSAASSGWMSSTLSNPIFGMMYVTGSPDFAS